MRRLLPWQVFFGAMLVVMSFVFCFINYTLFPNRIEDIVFYYILDIAFVFIEVLLVTFVLHRLLMYREKKALLKKLNMVIGAFFSEVGTALLKRLAAFDKESSGMASSLVIDSGWDESKFRKASNRALGYEAAIDVGRSDLAGLKDMLVGKRGFMLSLLENPNLLEHESFTNLLWAVFHLTEELGYRTDLKALSEPDRHHIAGDMKRVYSLLIGQWLLYAGHLKSDYPYLFSLAVRLNPFDKNARVEIMS